MVMGRVGQRGGPVVEGRGMDHCGRESRWPRVGGAGGRPSVQHGISGT